MGVGTFILGCSLKVNFFMKVQVGIHRSLSDIGPSGSTLADLIYFMSIFPYKNLKHSFTCLSDVNVKSH